MIGVSRMHPYSTDSDERIKMPFYFATAGILSALLLSKLLVFMRWSVPWWLDAPAVMGFYGFYYTFFDNVAWNWCRKIKLIKVPNLNGSWEGYVLSSFDGHTEEKPAKLEIKQSWTKISIVFKNGTSRSKSISSSITVNNEAEGVILSYEYQNEPNYDAIETMQIHRGFTRLVISRNGEELDGQYFTGRGRLSYGTMKFRKL